MKLITILVMMTPFLWSCSQLEEEASQEEPTEVEDQSRDEEERTEEEKLIDDLPDSASLEDWNLILVNPDRALDEKFEVDLKEVDNEQRIDHRIVDSWTNWKELAKEKGHPLFLASAYRDQGRQKENFDRKINGYMNDGMSKEEAKEKAKEYLTEPGHSEHHTGLALDIVDDEWIVSGGRLETAYEGEASQKWMIKTMSDFGFILRYPEGKEAITGIQYEPWHFRYVGPEHAQFMEEHDLVLEEYIELISKAKN